MLKIKKSALQIFYVKGNPIDRFEKPQRDTEVMSNRLIDQVKDKRCTAYLKNYVND